jgi:8-amino-7-oxononanoate synthase
VLAFDSALYLGMRHPAAHGAWAALTTGQPAAYAEGAQADAVCRGYAALCGADACVLAPSTLHLFWDLFPLLAQGRPATVLVDRMAYPVARWCASRIGAPCIDIDTADLGGLAQCVRRLRAAGRLAIVLADGYAPGMAGPPPLACLAGCVANGAGWLVVDDTQALGLLGAHGGGSLCLHGLQGSPHVVVGASLAKAFGAPLAVLLGSGALVRRYRASASTRVHCSPPSNAALDAGRRALARNDAVGDTLRARLRRAVGAMRAEAGRLGLELHGGGFPVQLLVPPHGIPGTWLHQALAIHGVRCLVQRRAGQAVLVFLLTAEHDSGQARSAMRLAATLVDQYRRQNEEAMRMCGLQL